MGKNVCGVILNGRTNDQIKSRWGRGFMIKTFSSNMNTVNFHLKIKPRPFLTILGFILKVNNEEISKVVPCSPSLILILTWDIDILFEKLKPETGSI